MFEKTIKNGPKINKNRAASLGKTSTFPKGEILPNLVTIKALHLETATPPLGTGAFEFPPSIRFIP
jgi:hypothetical protein